MMIDARYLQAETSGIGRYTEHLLTNLRVLAPELRLQLVMLPGVAPPVEGVRVQTFGAAPNSLRTRFALARALDFDGVDLFHSPFNILPANLPVPAVFTLHDIMWLIDPSYCTDSRWRKLVTGTFYRRLIPASVRDAEALLTVSEHSRDEIEQYFPQKKSKVHVSYNGVDPFFAPVDDEEAWAKVEPLIGGRHPYVLVVGQGSPYKNHYGALEGFARACRDRPDVRFVIVRRFQRGPARDFNRLAMRPDVASRFVHLEHVDGETLRALYSAARLFLFPSLYEGFGLPALEAMACGTPVVTSNRGAPAEISGDGGLSVDPTDYDSIAQAVRRLVNDDELHATKRAAGLKRAAEFTWKRGAEQTLRVYRSVLQRIG